MKIEYMGTGRMVNGKPVVRVVRRSPQERAAKLQWDAMLAGYDAMLTASGHPPRRSFARPELADEYFRRFNGVRRRLKDVAARRQSRDLWGWAALLAMLPGGWVSIPTNWLGWWWKA